MGKRVILTLLKGSFEQGFPVILRIRETGAVAEAEVQTDGHLPPAPDLQKAFEDWQLGYRQIITMESRIVPVPAQVTNISYFQLGFQLKEYLNDWLNSGSKEWQNIRDLLHQNLSRTDDEIQVIIQTKNFRLRQLPWHLWDLFSEHFKNAEIALSLTECQPLPVIVPSLTNSVRILAILGNTTGIDVNQDKAVLEKELQNAQLIFLEQPSRKELFKHLWEKDWDIIFFAGHSDSQMNDEIGRIYINLDDYLILDELENALRRAIDRGLKLAIFNSCNGLGLAHKLATWHLPQSIVMRESVPDRVAHEFLKKFLREFAQRKSLYVAVREARRYLQFMERDFPYASWLPVICQNPAAKPIIWPQPPLRTKHMNQKFMLFLLPVVVVCGVLLVLNRHEPNKVVSPTPHIGNPTFTPAPTPSQEERISFGEKTLFSRLVKLDKRIGIEAIANKNYEQAILSLQASLKEDRNDPETLIFLNNAKIKNQKNYTIAVSSPINTDPDSSKEILRGVAQAQNEINQAGGINGVPLKVAITNDDDNPKVAKQVASALVNQPEVLGVIGHSASDNTLATGKIYEAGKLVVISPVSTSTRLTGFSPYLFRTIPNDAVAAKALARYMLTRMQKKKAAVFFNSQSSYSRSLRDAFTTAVQSSKGQVIGFDFSAPGFDVAEGVEEAIKQGAEVLMLAADTSVIDKAIKVVQENNKRLSILGGDDVYMPETLKVGKEAADMVVAVPWDIDANQSSDFPSQSRHLWGNEVNWRTALSYDAARALIAALQRNPTRQGVQQVLSSSGFSTTGASGSIGFLASGDRRNATIQLVKIVPDKHQSNVYDFVPIEEINSNNKSRD